MAADETLDDKAAEDALSVAVVHRHMARPPDAAGAGHGEHALHLGIDVQEEPAGEHGGIERSGAQHARLLVGGEHHLQPGMGQRIIVQRCQRHGHSNAVVAAQGGTLRPDIRAVGAKAQAILGHIQVAVLVLIADHVQVPLENHRRGTLIARRGLLDDDHVVGLVLPHSKSPLLGKGHAIVADGAGVARAMGNGAERLKKMQHILRLQMTDIRHLSASLLIYSPILPQSTEKANCTCTFSLTHVVFWRIIVKY